ncbi:hypothetical protein [Streptomyces sp. NPDC049881]
MTERVVLAQQGGPAPYDTGEGCAEAPGLSGGNAARREGAL